MTFNQKYRFFYFLAIVSVPLSIVLAAIYSLWWILFISFIWTKISNFLFVQIGIHRYFAHNSFKTGRLRHIMFAIGSVLTGQGSPITWATHHLYHHKHSDEETDLHSPRHGFWHTILLWPINGEKYFHGKIKYIGISPKWLVKDSLLVAIHHHYFKIWGAIIFLSLLISWEITLFAFLAPAGWSLLHANILTNFISHWNIPGSYKNFETGDNSYNNKWVQRFQFGEGLHNNHHHDMYRYNQAMQPGEWDPAAWVIDKFLKVKS